MAEHEPLPPDLAGLFEKESKGYDKYEATQATSYAKVQDRIALTAATGTTTSASPGGAAKAAAGGLGAKAVALIAAGSLAAGLVIGRATAPKAATPRAPTEPAASAAPSPPAGPPTIATSVPSIPEPRPTTKAPEIPHGTLVRERELVETARSALARGRHADALVATERHAKEFPHGQLAEEREVLAITALLSLGRAGEAEARRARFVKTFPKSLLVPPSIETDGGNP